VSPTRGAQGNALKTIVGMPFALDPEHLRQCFEAERCEMETFTYKKVLIDGGDGLPAIFEIAFGWLGEEEVDDDDDDDYEEDKRRFVTGVNWSPNIINPFRQFGGHRQSLDSILTEQRAGSDEPIILFLHLAQPRVQYMDRGKSAVVTEKAIVSKIISAVEAVTKKWAKQRKQEERHASAITRRRACTIKDAAWEIIEDAYLKASARGTLPALARQIMYAARNYVQEKSGKPLRDEYFTQTLLPDISKLILNRLPGISSLTRAGIFMNRTQNMRFRSEQSRFATI
jgi:hypothetical protein